MGKKLNKNHKKMKLKLTIAFCLLAILLKAQQQKEEVSYRIDYWKPDSIYLVEVKKTPVRDGDGFDVHEDKFKMRDTAQISLQIKSLKAQAEQARQQATTYDQISESISRLYEALKVKLLLKN